MNYFNKTIIALSVSFGCFSYAIEPVAVIKGDDYILRGDPDKLPPKPPTVPTIPSENPNALAWGQYWNSVSSSCHDNTAMANGDNLAKNESGKYCSDNRYYCSYSMNPSNFPTGSFGVETLGEIHLGKYCKNGAKPATLNDTYMFDGVKEITGFLWLESNNLSNVNGLNDIETIGREVKLQDNKLIDVDGLQSLKSVNGYLNLKNNLLTEVDGLLSLENVNGNFDISNNNLENLDGLISLKKVTGNLVLTRNNIRDYRGLSNLEDVTGLIYIDDAIDGESYLLPNSGAWCDNQTYNYVSTKSFDKIHNLFAKSCGWKETDSDQVPSANGWGKYWNSISSSCKSTQLMQDGDNISESKDGTYCSDNRHYCTRSMNPNNFPSGSFGVETLAGVHLGRWCRDGSKSATLNDTYMFDGVKEITNFLWLEANNLTNLDGLDDLETVGREIKLQDNKLVNVDGLAKLRSVNGYFSLKNNELTEVDGLSSLENVNGNFDLSNNNLENLNGLSSLKTVSGNLILSGNNITDYSGLSNLEDVTGLIYIDNAVNGNNYNLPTSGKWCDNQVYNFINTKSFDDAHNLFAKACGWKETDSEQVPSANGWGKYWNSISSACKSTQLMKNGDNISESKDGTYCSDNRHYCTRSMNPNNFPSGSFGVETLAGVHLGRWCRDGSKSATLNDTYMFDGVKEITNFLWLEANNLKDVDGLNDLIKVGREIKLQDNKLENLDGLSLLESVNGYFSLKNNQLTDVDGLISLESVNGNFDLSNNNLSNLDGLNSLTNVSGNLILSGNNITDYSGLSNLENVGGLIYIDDEVNGQNYIMPTSGKWCDNKVYNFINTKSFDNIHKVFAKACGWSETDSEEVPSPNGWGKYWNSISSACKSTQLMQDGDNISESKDGTYCSDNRHYCTRSMNPNNFPSGSFGVETLTGVHLGRWCRDGSKSATLNDAYMFDGVRHITNFLWLEANKLTHVNGLNDLETVGREIKLQDNLLTNVDGLSSLRSVNGYLNLSNNNITDYSGLRSLESVTTIHVDEPSGTLTWPTSGGWCTNSTYLKLNKTTAQNQAQAACN